MPITPNTPRWRELLNRVFVGKRQGAQDLSVLDDIFPVFQLADPGQGEFHYGRGEVNWQQFMVQIAGGAGVFAQLYIQNLSSNMIVVVEKVLLVSAGGAGTFLLNLTDVTVPAGNPMTRTDGRGVGTTSPASVQAGVNAIVALPATRLISQMTITGNTPTNLLLEDVILAPNTALIATNAAANVGFSMVVSGYDRPAEPDDVRK